MDLRIREQAVVKMMVVGSTDSCRNQTTTTNAKHKKVFLKFWYLLFNSSSNTSADKWIINQHKITKPCTIEHYFYLMILILTQFPNSFSQLFESQMKVFNLHHSVSTSYVLYRISYLNVSWPTPSVISDLCIYFHSFKLEYFTCNTLKVTYNFG